MKHGLNACCKWMEGENGFYAQRLHWYKVKDDALSNENSYTSFQRTCDGCKGMEIFLKKFLSDHIA